MCLKEWCLILNDVKQAQDVKISRWYGNFKVDIDVQLHGFSDATPSAYDYCIHIWYYYDNYSHTISLVFSKSKIATVKAQTIPHLELLTTLLLANNQWTILMNNINQWTILMKV